MTIDEMYCRWAEQKYGLQGVTLVEFEHDKGWAGTDVTPGDPACVWVWVTSADGRNIVETELEVIPALIREICEFALRVEP